MKRPLVAIALLTAAAITTGCAHLGPYTAYDAPASGKGGAYAGVNPLGPTSKVNPLEPSPG